MFEPIQTFKFQLNCYLPLSAKELYEVARLGIPECTYTHVPLQRAEWETKLRDVQIGHKFFPIFETFLNTQFYGLVVQAQFKQALIQFPNGDEGENSDLALVWDIQVPDYNRLWRNPDEFAQLLQWAYQDEFECEIECLAHWDA